MTPELVAHARDHGELFLRKICLAEVRAAETDEEDEVEGEEARHAHEMAISARTWRLPLPAQPLPEA